jgi:tyrosinase
MLIIPIGDILDDSNYIYVHAHCSFRHSPVFDSRTGFGGDGGDGSNCVTDGPFASYTISLGPGHALNNTCLTRRFDESMIPYITSKQVTNATIQPTFERFWMELEGNTPLLKPHNSGHRAIGGVLADTWSSPGGKIRFCADGC